MKKLLVLKSGRWAEPGKPWVKQIKVSEGDTLDIGETVSAGLAQSMINSGAAELHAKSEPAQKATTKPQA